MVASRAVPPEERARAAAASATRHFAADSSWPARKTAGAWSGGFSRRRLRSRSESRRSPRPLRRPVAANAFTNVLGTLALIGCPTQEEAYEHQGEGSHRSIAKKYIVSLAIAGAVAAALASVALATPGSSAVGTIMARAAFLDSVDIKIKITEDSTGHRRRHHHEREVIRVRDAGDTVMQQIVIGPGGHTGWHSHPGPAIALVKSGELTLYSSDDPTCTGRTFARRAGICRQRPGPRPPRTKPDDPEHGGLGHLSGCPARHRVGPDRRS